MTKNQAEPIRDQKSDHLLTSENCVLTLIDYQPEQYGTVTSSSRASIDLNVGALCRIATEYSIPVVLSTVGVDLGVNQGTAQEIKDQLPGVPEIDRTGVNAWEDAEFRAAIEATGRQKIVIAGLWTEVCMAFATLDMLADGYEVYPVVDAVGGISHTSHETAITRVTHAGAQPVTAISFGGEIMRNWARTDSDNLRRVMNWYFPLKQKLDSSGA